MLTLRELIVTMYYSVSVTDLLEKEKNSEFSYQESNLRPSDY